MLLFENDPGKRWEAVSHIADFAAFLPAIALFGFGDFQQVTGHPLPQFETNPLLIGSSIAFAGGALLGSREALTSSWNKRLLDMDDDERSEYLRLRALHRSASIRGAGITLLGSVMAVNGFANHNDLNVGAGVLLGSSGANLLRQVAVSSENNKAGMKRVLGPQWV